MEKKLPNLAKIIFCISLTIVIASLMVTFAILYVNATTDGFIKNWSKLIKISAILITFIISVTCVILLFKNQDVAFKIIIFILFCLAVVLSMLYLLKITNFWDRVDDIDDLRNYVSSFGANAVLIFILLQIVQVVILPIPGVVAIGAGVALFGIKLGAIYSLIGILIGSFTAYYIGKYPGEKVVGWLVGKKNLEKTLKKVEGKDKTILTFMFIFPFFPDDVLCFVAGMSSMSQLYFAIMIVVTRIIGVYTTAFSVNGDFIPYNTVWGIILWAILIISTFVVAFLINKYSDKIEKIFKKKTKK